MTNFLRFQALNIKRLKRVDIDLSGINVLKIGGRNAQGKSSLCDAMVYLLSGKASQCKEPVHGDAKEGIVIGELDNGFILTRKIKPDGKSELVIEEKGEKGITKTLKRPAEIVERLTGKAWIDFDAVLKMEISETIRKVAGIDFTELEEKRALLFKQRTGVNGDVKGLKARLDSAPAYADAPADIIRIGEIMGEIDEADRHNQEIEAVEYEIERTKLDIAKRREEIARIQAEIDGSEHFIAMQTTSLQGKSKIDTGALRAEVANAEETNTRVRANAEAAKIELEMLNKEIEADGLSKHIADIDAEKEHVLSTTSFPIPGMGYRDGMVTYNGRPLNQASSSEWVEIVAATAFRSNPELKVLIIRNASLLDDQSMAALEDVATREGALVLAEIVGKDEGCHVIIEDGEIKT